MAFRFIFSLAASKGEVPITVKGFQFIGFADEAMQEKVAHAPWVCPKDETKLGAQQVVVLDDVPTNTVRFRINFLDEHDQIIGYYDTKVISLKPGDVQEIPIYSEDETITKLNIVFDPAKVPAEAESCDIEVLDAEGNVLAQTTDAGVDGYVFESVEMSAATVSVIYKDADGKEIASANGTVTGAQRGEECDVAIGEATPIKTLVTIDVANSYPMNVTKATYEVKNNSTEGDAQTATGTVDYTVTNDTGSCSISFEPQGEEVAITDVKLSNPKNEIPFEWLTYVEAQAVKEDGTLVLDVNDNEFAGGAGTE